MIAISCVVDVSKLNEALQYAQQWSSRTPAKCVNSCAVAVLNRTIELTPFVSIERIDTELATQIYYAKTATGKESTAKRNKRYSAGVSSIQRENRSVPLAVLIIQARARPGSRYNQLTNSQFAAPSPFKGVSRAMGAQLMLAAVHRMIATRHSSTKFLISGWVESRRQMRRAAFGEPPTFDAETGHFIENDLGRSTPAKEGLVAVCVIENLIGLGASKNSANYNKALFDHGMGPLQQAIDEVGLEKLAYVANKLFLQELSPAWRRLAA